MDENSRDLLGEELDDEELEQESGAALREAVRAPEALAVASLVLAIVSSRRRRAVRAVLR